MAMQQKRRFYAVLWSALIAFLILVLGQTIWGSLLVANFRSSPRAVPWSVAVMGVVLWLLWQYLGGRWSPRTTSESRKRALRANPVSGSVLMGALLAGVLSIIALAGLWIVFFRLVKTPANVLDDPSKYPLLTIVVIVVMSSLVSPIVEEIAFRGYCQQILERHFSGKIAVLFSSLLFMLAHANHGWYWSKLSVYFLAGVVFGAIARLTNSILTSLPVHIFGDLTFFVLIWPRDSARVLVTVNGADKWFWIHVAQAILFAVLALLAFHRLAKQTRQITH
ncbi:MAG TPA: type II CAAX endopeptidase family protein [Candidatus Sulfotelmatobacter sp.]|nr:type II CAAX endopeptidase family protein [Candidatus Sulfotelmatobacter sp.]